jgi:RHS repeat-associated protein
VITRYPHPDLKITTSEASPDSAAVFYLHRDHLASVRIVTDATGTIAEATGYSAYGERTTEAMTTAKGYIGERFDPETGLLYLNARYYDPQIARFVSPDDWDPTKEGVGTNRYAYSSQVGSRSVTSFLGDFLGSIFGQNPTSRQSEKALAQRPDNAVRDTAKTAASIAAQQTGVPDIIEGVNKRDHLQVGVGVLTMGLLIVPEAKAVPAGIRVAATETRFVADMSIIDRATNTKSSLVPQI